jgi:hypothetical protein
VEAYFQFVHDFLVLVSRPDAVYEWETTTSYWLVHDLASGQQPGQKVASSFRRPFQNALPNPNSTFTVPHHHEGVDMFRGVPKDLSTVAVQLTALGECLYLGESHGFHPGHVAIFRHRQPDGAQVLSVYGHLDRLAELHTGNVYQPGELIGTVLPTRLKEAMLHFAIGYGATWELELRSNPNIPLNAGATWIQQRYVHPLEYLEQRLEPQERRGWPLD